MSEPTLVVTPPAPPTGETGQPTAPVIPPVTQPTEEVHPAVQRINEDKAKLQAENEALKAKLKDQERAQLPEEDQIEEGFREMYSVRVINDIPAEDFAKLPKIIQTQLRQNPWAFTPQLEIDQAGQFAGSAKEYYEKIAPVALSNIKQMVDEAKGAPEQKPETKDPSLSLGGSNIDVGSYSEGQLRVIALTDPARYQQIMNAAKGK